MKTKKITKEEYFQEFCRDLRIRKRKAIYVRADIHERMERIAHSLKCYNVSLSALVTMILVHHINTYGSVHDQLSEEAAKRSAAQDSGKASGKKPLDKQQS